MPNAIDLQIAHQKLFESRHQKWLSNHQTPDPDAILHARMKKDENQRLLFIEDRVPHPWLGSGFPRARSILLSLVTQGFFVTFYPLTQFAESWDCVYSDMPDEVEFMVGYGLFFFKQKTAYEIGLGIPAEPLFRSNTASNSTKHKSPHLSGWRQIISLIT